MPITGVPILEDVFLGKGQFWYDATCSALDAASVTDGDYVKVYGMTDSGEIGLISDAKEKTNMEDGSKRYGSGMQDAPDKELKGYEIPFQGTDGPYKAERDVQQTFLQACKENKQFMVKIVWADGEENEFLYKSLGKKTTAPNSSEWKGFSISGKQNSDVTETKPTVI